MPKYSDWTLGQIEALINAVGGDEAARAVLRNESKLIVVPHDLFYTASTIRFRPLTNFVARDFFKVSAGNNSSVNISHIEVDLLKGKEYREDFPTFFLDHSKDRSVTTERIPSDGAYRTLGENGSCGNVLRYQTLNKAASHAVIMSWLGGEVKVETTLAEIAALMQIQANGEQGALLIDRQGINIFFVRDTNGVLRVVHISWGFMSQAGWSVSARVFGGGSEYASGHRVFSRGS